MCLPWVIGKIQHDYQNSFVFIYYCFIAFTVKRILETMGKDESWLEISVLAHSESVLKIALNWGQGKFITYHENTHNWIWALISTSCQSIAPRLREKVVKILWPANSKSSFPYCSYISGKKNRRKQKHRW